MFCPNCGQENEDSVRHCKNCGTFIPDLSVLGSNHPSDFTPIDQGLTYSALDQQQIEEFQNDASRYKEYNMSDVVAKKSHKKLIVWLIVIVSVLFLSIAAFFLVRFIIGAVTMNKIKDDPTKYVFSAYQTTAKNLSGSSDVLSRLSSGQQIAETAKTTIYSNYGVQKSVMSVDAENKKAYLMQSVHENGVFGAENKASDMTLEVYSTLDRGVFKKTYGEKSTDYYLDYTNLRQDAAASAFGPQGENILHLDQANYDMIMDVYEFVYNNLKQSDNPFGMKELADQLLKDFDQCGNVSVTEGGADIDGTKADAYIVTHTFTNTDVIKTLVNDLKNWAKTNININENVNKMLSDALDKMDIDAALDNLNASGQMNNFELTIRSYVSKSGALMQSEVVMKKDGQGLKLTLCCGADPEHSKKVVLKAGLLSGNDNEMVMQSITMNDESTDANEKITVSYVGFALNGSTVYSRSKASGDFTLTNHITTSTMGMSSFGGIQSDMPIDEMQPSNSMDFNVSGNIKMDNDSITVTCTIPVPTTGKDDSVTVEMYLSDKPEIVELTSDNDLLKASAKELSEAFMPPFGMGMTIPDVAPIKAA